ncbi:WASH complex subunit strumpellin-like protein [Diplonema papillatum]|nr:WASH complex subunit strumpellin-like protein [Diplonema papillatum]
MDFLGGENRCGQQLLKLVSRGSSIVAELSRLSENIPSAFHDTKTEYRQLIFDFAYLNTEDQCEEAIQKNTVLLERDEEFRETHMDILQRFYQLFESIWKYITDLLRFWEDVREGLYIQQTFESILVNQDGKQLMAESLYLYGVMLLQLDLKIEGKIRERMLISYLRYCGAGNVQNLNEVCSLVRATGFNEGKRPDGYPEQYLARVPVPADIVEMILGRIRSDDIYQMAYNFPTPEQRSTALATQAGMLYVTLFFRPSILKESKPIMREIVDKHFPDNWIISYYMGATVDLTAQWAPYKAAMAAIANTMQLDTVSYHQKEKADALHKLGAQLRDLLREGVLNEGFVLDEIHQSLLPCVRNCNMTLRWFILHETTQDKRIKPLVANGVTQDNILMLLLNTSQLEYQLREMFLKLIDSKADKWDELKESGRAKMEQISQYFAGEGVLAAENVEDGLASWFSDIADAIDELDYENSTKAGRKIQNLINALADVEEYHQVDSNLMVKQYLMDTRTLLRTMIRYVNVEDRVINTVQAVGDFSYGWNVINSYIPLMQDKVKRNPSLVMQLRSTFLKLASMMELPLTRIHEAGSLDLSSVSEYYSSNLVEFVRKVLAIIPSSMFEELQSVTKMKSKIVEVPSKMPKDAVRDYAQLDDRYALANITYQISKFTEGILAMEKTLMGVIQVDPQKLLEDGIRKELVDSISIILHTVLQFPAPTGKKGEEKISMLKRLAVLEQRLLGIKSSFEYVQDYMNVYGLKLWQEEFSRLINFNVEMECNNYLTKKTLWWQSRYQSTSIPIPRLPGVEGDRCNNFMGRLVQELLQQTDSRKTVYIDQFSAWYDERGEAVVASSTFKTMHNSIGTPGLAGCDKLLSFMIVKDLQVLTFRIIQKELLQDSMRGFVDHMSKQFSPPSCLPKDARTWYMESMEKGKRLWPAFLERIVRVGRCQLLRHHIAKELRSACKLESGTLHSALSTLDAALVNDVQAHYKDPETHRYPNGRRPILPEFTAYLSNCGMYNPYTTIYLTADPITHLTFVLVLFVVTHLPRFVHDRSIDCLVVRKKDDVMDGAPFVIGLVTVLKQFHAGEKDVFVAYLCQYCRVLMNEMEAAQAKLKEKERTIIPPEVSNCLFFLCLFCKYAGVERKQIENLIPPYLITAHREYAARLGGK